MYFFADSLKDLDIQPIKRRKIVKIGNVEVSVIFQINNVLIFLAWSPKEIKLVKEEFSQFLKNKYYPSSAQIK